MPVVRDVMQPFHELCYLWVQDKQPQDSTMRLAGLADKVVKYINISLASFGGDSPMDKLIYKDSRMTKNDTDVIIPAGSQFFMVVDLENVQKCSCCSHV